MTRLQKLNAAALCITAFSSVGILIVLAGRSSSQEKPVKDSTPPVAPAPNAEPKKTEPALVHRVTRHSARIYLRIVDAADAKPIGLASIVIDNGNLASELGGDSDAVTWKDGRAILTHGFFVWEAQPDDEKTHRPVFQGPWIQVTAEGYEYRKAPLSDFLDGKDHAGLNPRNELVITLRRKRAAGPELADLSADYIYGNGFVYEHLEISPAGRYHYAWHNDVVNLDNPHDQDRYESRGRCSIVNGVVHLDPEGPFSSDLREMMGNDYVPIRWGDRRYLISEKERVVFCSAINRGVVPRYMRNGPFVLRRADLEKLPDGVPEVPEEWARFLLPKPVDGTITEVLADETAILNLGAKHGLNSGMELAFEKRDYPFMVKVLFTETDRSVVRLDTRDGRTLPGTSHAGMPFKMLWQDGPFVVGESVSSRSPRMRSGF
jgi:hypothetical protein